MKWVNRSFSHFYRADAATIICALNEMAEMKSCSAGYNPAGNNVLKANNRNTRTRC